MNCPELHCDLSFPDEFLSCDEFVSRSAERTGKGARVRPVRRSYNRWKCLPSTKSGGHGDVPHGTVPLWRGKRIQAREAAFPKARGSQGGSRLDSEAEASSLAEPSPVPGRRHTHLQTLAKRQVFCV